MWYEDSQNEANLFNDQFDPEQLPVLEPDPKLVEEENEDVAYMMMSQYFVTNL